MTRVFAPGVFDVFHIGHLNYLKAASQLGDYLIVAVQEDRSAEQQKHIQLVTRLSERMALIENLRFVDEVVSYADVFQGPLLTALQIDVFACGVHYGEDERFPEQRRTLQFCAEHNIRVARIHNTEHVSSTRIRNQLHRFWSARAAKAAELPAGVTTLGSFQGDQAQVRQQTLRECTLIRAAAQQNRARSLLDLGCGDGRHLAELVQNFDRIVGVDFASELLELARGKVAALETTAEVSLYTADATLFRSDEHFDLILLSGLTPSLDDEQVATLLQRCRDLAHPQARLIVRTPVGLSKRIDLVNFFSAELGTTYTAYYRTQSETIRDAQQAGWQICSASQLYQHRPDTAMWWFEFVRATP